MYYFELLANHMHPGAKETRKRRKSSESNRCSNHRTIHLQRSQCVGFGPPTPAPQQRGWDGGDGVASSITGSPVYRAGGGGGCGRFTNNGIQGIGGLGGGANGSNPVDSPNPGGTANTGGGGGGTDIGNPPFSPVPAGPGGSGVVIIKEPNAGFKCSGVWDMNALYDNVKAGTWTT